MRVLKTILILLLLSNFYCLSNDVLWQRVPSSNRIFSPAAIYSSKNNSIISVRDWIAIYDTNDSAPFNLLRFDKEKHNTFRIERIFTAKDSNILGVQYPGYIEGFGSKLFTKVNFYEIPSFKLIDTFYRSHPIDAFSSNNDMYLRTHSNIFRVHNINGEEIYLDSVNLKDFNESKLQLTFSPDDKFLIGTYQGSAYIFDLLNKTNAWESNPNNKILKAFFSEDMKFFILSCVDSIYFHDFKSGLIQKTIKNQNKYVIENLPLAISSDNKYLSVIYDYPNEESELIIINLENDKLFKSVILKDLIENIPDKRINIPAENWNEESYNNIQYVGNDKLLISSNMSSYLFDILNNTIRNIYSTHNTYDFKDSLRYVFFANQDNYLITVGTDKTIVWDAKTGSFIKILNFAPSWFYCHQALIPNELYSFLETHKFITQLSELS